MPQNKKNKLAYICSLLTLEGRREAPPTKSDCQFLLGHAVVHTHTHAHTQAQCASNGYFLLGSFLPSSTAKRLHLRGNLPHPHPTLSIQGAIQFGVGLGPTLRQFCSPDQYRKREISVMGCSHFFSHYSNTYPSILTLYK